MVAHGACHALFIGHKREPQQLPHVSQSKQKRQNYLVTFKITRILTPSNTVTQMDLWLAVIKQFLKYFTAICFTELLSHYSFWPQNGLREQLVELSGLLPATLGH